MNAAQRLTAASVAMLVAPAVLLAAGDDWWALRPIEPPPVPAPALEPDWARTPIDAFVLDKLAEHGLQPAPEADRRTLVRRLKYNLHGLPPSPAEIAAFIDDASPTAYDDLVDRLLASPRYGERWGRHWLDVVHYGESHGYDKDKRRPNAWPYRDYVVRAFNEDRPYARFVEEQLAGDVLFPDDPDGIVATGFIAAGPWDFVGHVELREGTVDKAIARSNDRDDMVAAAMSTFTSVTAHCARCHDHKFDPISQKDYYSLQAVFAGVDRADRPYDPDPGVKQRRTELERRRGEAGGRLAELNAALKKTESPAIAAAAKKVAELEAESTALAAARSDRSPTNGYHSGILPSPDHVRWVEVDLGRDVAVDEVALVPARPTDFPDTPGFGFPARFRVELASEPFTSVARGHSLASHDGADFANPGDAAVKLPAGGARARYVRVTASRLWKRTGDFVFALAELEVWSGGRNVALGAQVASHDSIEAGRWARSYLVDGFSSRQRLTAQAAGDAAREKQVEASLAQARQEHASLAEASLDAASREALARVRGEIADLESKLRALPAERRVYAAASHFRAEGSFTPAATPRPIHFLHRGDVKTPGELMTPGALSCVSELPARFELSPGSLEGERRAALARWATDRRNPLAWRSIANRVWQYHFGRGLVDSPNDFGRMGAAPTHPELLDWLAARLRDRGGSLKEMHRLILTSAAYRQSSRHDPAFAATDADNRWLWRMNRTRLEAEAARDALLAISGKLDLTMGGPSVDHFVFKDDHSPTYDYTRFDVDSPASFRRGVYRFIVRSVPDPFLECLDCADPSILTAKRNNTLTALQALAFLNTPFAVRQAEHFAARVREHASDLPGRIEAAYEIALGRPPAAGETALLTDHAAKHGLENACRLILNSNELIFID